MNNERLLALQEADKRGLLKGPQKEAYDEAVKRGLIGASEIKDEAVSEPESGMSAALGAGVDKLQELGYRAAEGLTDVIGEKPEPTKRELNVLKPGPFDSWLADKLRPGAEVDEWAEKGIERNVEEQKAYEPTVKSYKDIGGLKDFGNYAGELVAGSLPYMAAAANPIGAATLAGGLSQEAYEKQPEDEKNVTKAVASGTGQMLLERLGIKVSMGQLGKDILKDGVVETAKRMGKGELVDAVRDPNFAKRIFKGAVGEGLTETGQEALAQWGAGKSIDEFEGLDEAFVGGLTVGGVMRTGSETAQKVMGYQQKTAEAVKQGADQLVEAGSSPEEAIETVKKQQYDAAIKQGFTEVEASAIVARTMKEKFGIDDPVFTAAAQQNQPGSQENEPAQTIPEDTETPVFQNDDIDYDAPTAARQAAFDKSPTPEDRFSPIKYQHEGELLSPEAQNAQGIDNAPIDGQVIPEQGKLPTTEQTKNREMREQAQADLESQPKGITQKDIIFGEDGRPKQRAAEQIKQAGKNSQNLLPQKDIIFAGNESGVNVARNGQPFKTKRDALLSKEARAARRAGQKTKAVTFDNGFGWTIKGDDGTKQDSEQAAAEQSPEADTVAQNEQEDQAQPAQQEGEALSLNVDAAPGKEDDKNIAGEMLDDEWQSFTKESGTKNIPRSEMPQIKAENRGAMVNFMKARDIGSEKDEVPAQSLKPTQQEFSPAKVKQAKEFKGGNRSILVSNDGYVLDGHHQWLAAREKDEPVKVTRLNAPIERLVPLAKEMPSTETQDGTGKLNATGNEELATTGKLIEQEPATTEQQAELPPILKTTKRKWLQSEAKKQGLKKGSPGFDVAIAKIEEGYEPAIDKALAESSFETYQEFNSDTPQSINRQAYSELRKEFGYDKAPPPKSSQPNKNAEPPKSGFSLPESKRSEQLNSDTIPAESSQATVKQPSNKTEQASLQESIDDLTDKLEIESTDKNVRVYGNPEKIRSALRASGINFEGAEVEGGLSFGKKLEAQIRTAIEGDDVKFFSKGSSNKAKGVSKVDAESAADRFLKSLKGAAGIKVKVLQTSSEAEKLWRMSLDGATVKGAYSENSKTVYVIAENIDSDADLKQTLAHETIAHGGLDTVIGKEAKQEFIDRIKKTKGRKAFEKYWKDANNDYWDASQDVKAEEIFARFVESEPSKGEVKYWWNALKRFIRKQLDKLGVVYREDDELTAMRDMLESIVKGFKAQRETVATSKTEMDYSQSDKKFSRTAKNDTSPAPNKIADSVKKAFNRDRFEKSSVPEWEALNAQLRETDKTAGDKIKRQLSRWFMPGGNLPETVQQAKRGRDRDVAVHEFDVSMLVGKLNSAMKSAKINPDRLTDEQWTKYHQFLIGENDGKAFNKSERDTLILMREHIDGLTKDYVTSVNNKLQQRLEEDGAIDPKESARLEKMLGNMGKYLNRSYKAFDDPKWFEKIPTKVADDARAYLMKQYEKDGATAKEAQQKAQVTMNEMVKTGTAYDSLGAFIAESKLGSKDLSTLIPRKDISPEIRALLGEYADPRINYAKSVSKMSAMIANDKLLSTIRDMGINNFIFEKDSRPPNATVQLAGEKSEVYAPLNGMWTTPEIKEAFEDAMGGERGEGWLDKAITVNGFIKFGKTVLSPTTAMRNVMSAYFFTVANGHFNQKYMKQAVAAFNAQVKEKVTDGESDYIKRLIKLGVLYDSANAGDIVKVMTDGKINQMLEGRSGAAFENLRWLTAKATGFYRFGDDFWKIVGFENEKAALVRTGMKEGEAEALAAERIQNTYPTYSRVGKAGAWLSRFPLAGTFVSFPAEVIRTTGNMMKLAASEIKSDNPKIREMGAKRIVGMSLASGGMFALSALSAAMFGVTDDEEEALRDLAPPWQKNSTFIYAGRDSDNNLRYFDMSFLDPYAYWKRPIEAMMRDQPVNEAIASSLSDMVSPFLGTDITTSKILEVLSNKKSSGGQVYKENDTAIRKSADIAGHLALGLAPGFVNNAWRIGMAAGDVKRSTGKPYSLSDEMLALVGFRSSTFDPKVGLYYRTFDFNGAIAEARKELSGVLRDPNKVSDEEISAAKARAKTKQEQAFKQMSRLIKAAQTGGASRRQVVQILLLAGISKRNVGFLLREQVPPVNLSDRSFESAVKRAQLIMDNESAREVRSRFNRIIKND